ncbi:MAG: ATP-binding protein [Phycisphaerales bacterium JB063]
MPSDFPPIWTLAAGLVAVGLVAGARGLRGGWRSAVLLGAFGLGFASVHEIGSATYFQPIGVDPESVAVFWPSSGLLMGVFAVCRWRLWPWVVLVASVVLVHSDVRVHGLAWGQTAIWTPCALAEGMLGALPIGLLSRGVPDLTRPRLLLVFVVFGVLLATAASAAVGSLAYVASFEGFNYLPIWQVWWLSDALGVLAVAPVVVAWARPAEVPWGERPGWHLVEGAVLFVALLLVSMVAVGPIRLATESVLDYPYLVVPLIVWAALRFTARFASAATLAAAMVAVFTAKGALAEVIGLDPTVFRGPFFRTELPGNETVYALQAFLFVMLLSSLLLVAVAYQRRRADQQALTLRDQLYDAQRMETVAQLAGGVAHDMNNLLAVLALHRAQLEKRLGHAPDLRGSLQAMDTAVDQASALSRSMLSLSRRPEAQRCEPIDLWPAVLKSVALCRGLMPARVRIHLAEPVGPVGRVRCDPGRLQQVIMNLLVNARDAMGAAGGRVDIGLRRAPDAGDRVDLYVKDTGSGIAPELLPQIFEPLFTTKPPGEGTGLGLSVVASIVREMGGTIDAQSEVGVGTRFTLRLPRVGTDSVASAMPDRAAALQHDSSADASLSAVESAPRAGVPRGSARRVWVAMAHRQVRGAVVAELMSHGLSTASCEDPSAMLARLSDPVERGTMLISDVQLLSHQELVGAAESRAALLLIGTEAELEVAEQLGLVTLAKPFRIHDVATAVESMRAET